MMNRIMAAVGRQLNGEEPRSGDLFGFRFRDAVAMVEFEGGDVKVNVTPIHENFDENIYISLEDDE
ncbi:hypothetical protein GCM10007416_00420 [Kroppenstedtia guangzhouensis]|jgi:hypothetical protein|uniref:Uncharacterized protein n=1 Tax=Kroppenstedtia guangzhouensis TaxID=1274356 RepID=A0ABQ1FVB5_9BACL|nr:hypothetical protein [Kroppenstedtia guangzhouensis]GGA31826.1 hypothetical protein GCM10007416_00420 [Kroppenstedtia guangzhouensis]